MSELTLFDLPSVSSWRCACGATVRRGFLTQHRRTAKHARQMEAAA
ncbi:hypothetical protein [Gordonia spumicola]|nr:hypothetical protein [Gordonia spumicola]